MTKRFSTIFVLLMTLFCLSSSAFAAAWTIPTNVRYVQREVLNSTRTYTKIQDAINSIPTSGQSMPSATNPYLVKVMPGEYNEVVTLRPYVYLEGSGRENTIISSSVHNIDFDTCTVGTVTMANNSALRSIKVVNSAAAGDYATAGISVPYVTASIEDVDVYVGDNSVAVHRNNGVCAVGSSGHSRMNNVYIEIHNESGDSNGVLSLDDGSQTLTNSQIIAYMKDMTGGYNINAVDCDLGSGLGITTVSNSSVAGVALQAGSGGINLINLGGNCKGIITNSALRAANGGSLRGVLQYDQDLTLLNSQVYLTGGAEIVGIDWNPGGNATAKVANSLIQGGFSNCSDLKLIGNFNENVDPITCP